MFLSNILYLWRWWSSPVKKVLAEIQVMSQRQNNHSQGNALAFVDEGVQFYDRLAAPGLRGFTRALQRFAANASNKWQGQAMTHRTRCFMNTNSLPGSRTFCRKMLRTTIFVYDWWVKDRLAQRLRYILRYMIIGSWKFHTRHTVTTPRRFIRSEAKLKNMVEMPCVRVLLMWCNLFLVCKHPIRRRKTQSWQLEQASLHL